MGPKPMILLKMIEILLMFVNVWGRSKKITEVPGQLDHPLLDLATVVIDLKGEKWKGATSSPFEAGFLNVRKSGCLSPSGSHASFFLERVLLHP
jgi:hypothetical protein